MRILYFGDADSVHLQRWVSAMAERGAECHVVTRRPGQVPGAQSVQTIRTGGDALGWFLALPQIRAITRRLAPDAVHGHYITSSGLWAAASGHPRVALTAWGSDILLTPHRHAGWRTLTGWILRRAGLITADSQDVLAQIRSYGVRAVTHEILWGADTDFFAPAVEPHQIHDTPAPSPHPSSTSGRGGLLSLSTAVGGEGWGEGAVLEAPFVTNEVKINKQAPRPKLIEWLSLRSWEPNYHIDRIIDAYASARRQAPERIGRLHLLGGGSLEPRLRAQVQALGLDDCIIFHGRKNETAMRAIMQQCDVSVSVPESDATSVSVLESMSCGLAMLVSDLPANRQWVDAQGGVVVPTRDTSALSHAMLELAGLGADERLAMGAHNRKLVLAKASRRLQMDLMFKLYQDWLAPSGLSSACAHTSSS